MSCVFDLVAKSSSSDFSYTPTLSEVYLTEYPVKVKVSVELKFDILYITVDQTSHESAWIEIKNVILINHDTTVNSG